MKVIESITTTVKKFSTYEKELLKKSADELKAIVENKEFRGWNDMKMIALSAVCESKGLKEYKTVVAGLYRKLKWIDALAKAAGCSPDAAQAELDYLRDEYDEGLKDTLQLHKKIRDIKKKYPAGSPERERSVYAAKRWHSIKTGKGDPLDKDKKDDTPRPSTYSGGYSSSSKPTPLLQRVESFLEAEGGKGLQVDVTAVKGMENTNKAEFRLEYAQRTLGGIVSILSGLDFTDVKESDPDYNGFTSAIVTGDVAVRVALALQDAKDDGKLQMKDEGGGVHLFYNSKVPDAQLFTMEPNADGNSEDQVVLVVRPLALTKEVKIIV